MSCCWRANRYHCDPAQVLLVRPNRTGFVEGCYFQHLNSCSGKLSREHLISEAALKIISRDGPVVRVGGSSWIPEGTEKTLGLGSLTCHCLCSAHNSDLNELDAAAGHKSRRRTCERSRP